MYLEIEIPVQSFGVFPESNFLEIDIQTTFVAEVVSSYKTDDFITWALNPKGLSFADLPEDFCSMFLRWNGVNFRLDVEFENDEGVCGYALEVITAKCVKDFFEPPRESLVQRL